MQGFPCICRRVAYAASMSTSPPRKTTRERILEAALDLFVEVGFGGTTISEVERRVGLAAGTGSFYRHFSSKEALLRAAVDREVERCMAETQREQAAMPAVDDPRAQFVGVAERILRDMRRFDRLLRLMLTEGDRVPEVRESIATALRGAGAVSWAEDPSTLVGVAALLGYHLMESLGAGSVPEVGQDQFIDALATVAAGGGLPGLARRH